MLLLKEEGKGLLVEGGLLHLLGEHQHPGEDVLKLLSLPPAGGGVKEGEEEGMGQDVSQGGRHLQTCYLTELDLPAYSGDVQIGIPG